MADIFKPFSRGEKLNLQAEFLNTLQDVVRDYLRRKGTKAGPVVIPPDTEIYCKNTSTTTHREQYAIVALGAPLVAPDEETDSFFGKAVFEASAPTEGEPFAILQEPCHKGGGIVRTRVGGWSWARLLINSAAHDWAEAVTGEYEFLESKSSGGSARILWSDTIGSTPPATILNGAISKDDVTITVDVNTGWDTFCVGSFVVTIGTEDILVRSVNSFSWNVVRGWNGTTAAAHADNASVAYTSGTVWGLIGWDVRGVPGGNGITSINGLTSATQTLAVGTSGAGFSISSSATTHTFNLTDASSTYRGVVSIGAQTFAGEKTFNGASATAITTIGDGGVSTNGGDVVSTDGEIRVANTTASVTMTSTVPSSPDYSGSTSGMILLADGGNSDGLGFGSRSEAGNSAGGNIWVISADHQLPAFGVVYETSVGSGSWARAIGIWQVVVLAKITAGGTDGSITVSGGVVTAYTAPT